MIKEIGRKLRSIVQSNPVSVEDWLAAAERDAKAAKLIVDDGNIELFAVAVTHVQQSAEKAVKALLISQGVPHKEVKNLGHNAIAAFLTLFRHSTNLEEGRDIWRLTLTPDRVQSVYNIVHAAIGNKAQKRQMRKLLKDLFPAISNGSTLAEQTDVEQWHARIRKYPSAVINELIEHYDLSKGVLFDFANLIDPKKRVDPRPLLLGDVTPREWVFGKKHAAMPLRFRGKSVPEAYTSQHTAAIEIACEAIKSKVLANYDYRRWPDSINLRDEIIKFATRSNNWVRLYIIGAITTPHAVTSRYPSDPDEASIGTEHYDSNLGIVKCVPKLTYEMNDTIRILIEEHAERR